MSTRLTKKMRAANGRRRTVVQLGFLALILGISISHTLAESGIAVPLLSSASLHGVCPFGGVVSLWQFITTGTMVKKVHESSFALMAIVFGLAVLFGPVFCGWICPFGTVQESVGKLGRRIMGRRYNNLVPYSVDKWLRYLRYLVLAWVIYMTAATGQLIFSDYDPYFTIFNLWSDELAISGVVILVVVLALSLLVERPFCKYACPYGTVLGVTNLFRLFGIRRNGTTCIDCGACDRSCPMNIAVSTAGRVRDHQCISCLRCTSEQACPVAETVELRSGRFQPLTAGATGGASSATETAGQERLS